MGRPPVPGPPPNSAQRLIGTYGLGGPVARRPRLAPGAGAANGREP